MKIDELQIALETAAKELTYYAARVDGIEKAKMMLADANNTLAAQVASLKEVNQMIDTDRAVLQQKLDVAVDIADSLKARVEELESYTKGTAVTIDQLRASKANAVQGFSEQMERANLAEAAFADARAREDKANFRAAAYADSIDRMQQELDTKKEREKGLEQCLKNMREEHVRLIAERDQLLRKAVDMEGNWRLTIAECDKIKQRIRPVELENYILKTNMQNAQNTVRDLQTATEAKELALAAQVAENTRLIGVITRLRQKLSEYWVADMEGQKPEPSRLGSFLASAIKQTEGE